MCAPSARAEVDKDGPGFARSLHADFVGAHGKGIGYALAEPSDQGRGLGTKALGLLQRFARDATRLTKLIIITSRDNSASQRIAQKCGFLHTGPSREDPINGMVFEWVVRR